MHLLVVNQWNRFHGNFFAIKPELSLIFRIRFKPGDSDVINGLPKAVVDFVGRPVFRQIPSD